jgi:hypothetical protein
MTKKPKVNPHCPVPGCRAKAPHLSDPVVAGLAHNFSDLGKVDVCVDSRAWEVDG